MLSERSFVRQSPGWHNPRYRTSFRHTALPSVDNWCAVTKGLWWHPKTLHNRSHHEPECSLSAHLSCSFRSWHPPWDWQTYIPSWHPSRSDQTSFSCWQLSFFDQMQSCHPVSLPGVPWYRDHSAWPAQAYISPDSCQASPA